MKKVLLGLAVLLLGGSFAANAQQENQEANKYLDFVYDKKAVRERNVVPYPGIREADVIYARRIWRIIDVREKKNLVMAWPKNPLNKILYELATTGEEGSTGKVKAYSTDSLHNTMTVGEVKELGSFCETVQVQVYPDDPYFTKDSLVCTDFDYMSVNRFMLMEEWIFDKQTGEFFPRIIGIAPLYKPSAGGMVELGEMPMYWLDFEELRSILIKEEVFNRQNDAMRMTYYDFFEMRMFTSYIVKESNNYDLFIKDFPEYKDNPMEALYKSETVKTELFNWEHDLWEY